MLGNACTIIAFRLGPPDAKALAREFQPKFEEIDLVNLPNHQIYPVFSTELMQALMPRIIGASRRPLNEIINSDPMEHEKVMRFFEGQAHIIRIAPEPTLQPE